ncbi:MAG: TraR/DksA C4-type zinc finger protein [Magnetococcales bacterium]|nr:TraR/DksA C4-type zinc finger protein [Magnetococcales bacterium]
MDTVALKNQLLDREKQLKRLSDAAKSSCKPVELDQTRVGRLSRMDAMQLQAMSQETERRRKLEMIRIRSALVRIESDDYGYCVGCDDPIPPKRLAFDPAILTCIQCARGGDE